MQTANQNRITIIIAINIYIDFWVVTSACPANVAKLRLEHNLSISLINQTFIFGHLMILLCEINRKQPNKSKTLRYIFRSLSTCRFYKRRAYITSSISRLFLPEWTRQGSGFAKKEYKHLIRVDGPFNMSYD